MADEQKLYKRLVTSEVATVGQRELSTPDAKLDKEVADIFTQAKGHRNLLINFYICYTVVFTIFVLTLIGVQAHLRVVWHNSNFEIIPEWALNLLVVGMFGQFIGLLAIVTQRVWDFTPFFTYRNQMRGVHPDDEDSAHK